MLLISYAGRWRRPRWFAVGGLVACALMLALVVWCEPGSTVPDGATGVTERYVSDHGRSGHPRAISTVAAFGTRHASVAGIVVDEEIRPVAGAIVHVTGEAPVRSGTDGRFCFSDIAPGSHYLLAHTSSAAAGPLPLELADGHRLEVTVRLHSGVALTVAVVSVSDGAPIPHARGVVVLTGERGEAGRLEVVADGAGELRFPLLPLGNYKISAEAEGFAPTTQLLTMNERSGLIWRSRIALERGVILTGRVVDESGAPVAGARVSSRQAPRAEFQRPYRPLLPDSSRLAVETGGDGAFRYAVPIGQSLVLVARHARYATVESEPIIAARPSQLTLVLRRGRTLTGRVVDRARHALAGATVSDGPPESASEHVARTAPDGVFMLEGIDPRRRQAVLFAETRDGRASPVLVPLPAGFEREIELVIEYNLRLAGEVHDADGTPVADAVVRYRRQVAATISADDLTAALDPTAVGETRTDGDGVFEIDRLPPGDVQLMVRGPSAPPDRACLPPMVVITARAGDEAVTVTLPAFARVHGRVVDSQGGAVSVFQVSLDQFGGPVRFESADGRFELAHVDPTPGKYYVSIRSEGTTDALVEAQILPGKTTDLGAITLAPGRMLRGRVLDAIGGDPIHRAVVSVESLGGMRVTSGRTDELGGFELAVPRDSVLVHAAMPGVGGSRFELVPSHQGTLDLRLPETVLLEVVPDGDPIVGALTVVARRADLPDHGLRTFVLRRNPGEWIFRAHLPPGEYIVHATRGRLLTALKKRARKHEVAVKLAAGQPRRIQLALEAPGS